MDRSLAIRESRRGREYLSHFRSTSLERVAGNQEVLAAVVEAERSVAVETEDQIISGYCENEVSVSTRAN